MTYSWHFCRIGMKKIIITIDGWSSCGKSTLAKQMAKALGYIYVDSGAMYRAITLYFLRNHVDWTDTDQVKKALKDISLDFEYNPKSEQSEIYLNGENVEYVIRDLVIAEKVSEVAAIKEVRKYDVSQQQKMGKNRGIVMDGRVERRFQEMFVKNPNITIDEVKANLEMRDYIDSNREVSPLKKADDALLLDNTRITEKEQFQKAMKWVKEMTSDQ